MHFARSKFRLLSALFTFGSRRRRAILAQAFGHRTIANVTLPLLHKSASSSPDPHEHEQNSINTKPQQSPFGNLKYPSGTREALLDFVAPQFGESRTSSRSRQSPSSPPSPPPHLRPSPSSPEFPWRSGQSNSTAFNSLFPWKQPSSAATPAEGTDAASQTSAAFFGGKNVSNRFSDSKASDLRSRIPWPEKQALSNLTKTNSSRLSPTEFPIPAVESAEPPLKLSTSAGRSVNLNNKLGMDVGRSLRLLSNILRRNNVRKDSLAQRFHERPGVKRKRLKRERWRKRFKDSFAATVQRVKEMRDKGWTDPTAGLD